MLRKSELSNLRGKKVYFAHQSVGYNIVAGMTNIIDKNRELDFIKIVSPEDYLKADTAKNDSIFYFIHSGVGSNMFPDSKISDFRNKLGTMGQIDAAFLKFCFIDVNRKTNVNLLYKNYLGNLKELEKEYLNTKFLYFTCPVTAKENFLFGIIKAVLRRPDDLNRNRHRFNNLIRSNKDIELFDLAYLESHHKDEPGTFEKDYLLSEYSESDGAHLNQHGSEVIAVELLTRLNTLLK